MQSFLRVPWACVSVAPPAALCPLACPVSGLANAWRSWRARVVTVSAPFPPLVVFANALINCVKRIAFFIFKMKSCKICIFEKI